MNETTFTAMPPRELFALAFFAASILVGLVVMVIAVVRSERMRKDGD